MKVLHTSDLHLGKSLLEESFYEDQKYMLEEIIQIIKEKKVEVIMISGDIYDKNIPSVDAVHLLNKFLNDLSKENIEDKIFFFDLSIISFFKIHFIISLELLIVLYSSSFTIPFK